MKNTTDASIIDSMFNFNRKLGEDSAIFFGSPRGLHDSVVVKHPYLAQLYDSQIATNWKYNEFSLAKDREQMQYCPKSIKDLMLYNILFQWHRQRFSSTRQVSHCNTDHSTNCRALQAQTAYRKDDV